MSDMEDTRPFITLEEAQERYGMSRHTMKKYASQAGCLYKIGFNIRVDKDSLDEYIRKNCKLEV